ncbi:MerR family transcriptional regulator [Streptomyces sp. NPDC046977]|uniref:MerR family transcriptional regulator n=1 Tax=Streptomyces sp. NPDC046977 TaxID=3154703 RepID=UPI0033C4BDB7
MDELAEAAGVPVRTVRFYRERKLLPAPRREGRIAWYNEHHLARLRTITALLERGHTLGGIAELMNAWESGRHDVGELLGLDPALPTPWSEEEPLRLTPEALADYYGDQATAENLATALDIGYIAVDGDDVVHVSRRLLEASSGLVKEGIPLAEVLSAGRDMRHRMDLLAELFVQLARSHVLPGAEADLQAGDTTRLTEAIARLRPLVEVVVEVELALAMDRRLREELKG